jgi:hypothetical protein
MLVGRRVLSDNPLELSLRRRLGRDLGRFNPRPGPKAAPDRPCPSAILELPHIPTSGSSYLHDFGRYGIDVADADAWPIPSQTGTLTERLLVAGAAAG